MSQPCFDHLSERLLHAGIAPRHVHRYVRELSDHFDDLVAEEKMSSGTTRERAETRALSRLGSEDDLTAAMLARPELKSFTARYPWAVFGLGPIALLVLGVAAALFLEVGIILFLNWLLLDVMGYMPGSTAAKVANAKIATEIFTAYNTLAVYGAPLILAWLFHQIGSGQRMRPAWIATGVVLVCILGGFQNLIFYDTGCKGCGHLLIQSAFIPPFPHFAEGLARAATNLIIAGGVWWLVHRKASVALTLHTAQM